MAGISYRITDEEVLGAFGRLARAAAHTEDALHAIGAYGVFSTQRRFETQTDPDGNPWRPLSPRTASRRVGRGRRGIDHILRLSGRLYQSQNYLVTSDGVEWGSNVEYARIHQLGGEIQMPAREQRITLRRIRKKGGGFVSRFAKANAKNATERTVKVGAHKVRIPARPYLGISAEDSAEIVEIVNDHFRSEAGGRS